MITPYLVVTNITKLQYLSLVFFRDQYVQVTYKLTCRWFWFPLSRLVAHVARITDKPEPSVAFIVNLCTGCCAAYNGNFAVGWNHRFLADNYKR